MSGRAFCRSIFDRIVVFGYFNEHLVDLLHLMITRECKFDDSGKNPQSWLLGIPIPPTFVKRTYEAFFEYTSIYSATPVALYRTPKRKDPPFKHKEEESYTYTNPDKDILLKANDFALVLVPYTLVKNHDKFQAFKEAKKGLF